jgi:hypothetical protein
MMVTQPTHNTMKTTTPEHMTTKDTIENLYEVTIYWNADWSGYVIHKAGNDYYEKSGGLKIEGYELVDADGSYALPLPVFKALQNHGIKVSPNFL